MISVQLPIEREKASRVLSLNLSGMVEACATWAHVNRANEALERPVASS